MSMHIKKGDTVVLRSGKYEDRITEEGKVVTGKVIAVSPKEGKVIVEGIHKVHKHVKPRKQGEAGGIIETEGAIYACKVQLYCANCKAGRRSRVVEQDGKKIRVCTKCGKEL